MTIPAILDKGLRVPVIAAPLFLISGPELVKACCKAGVIGTFPTLNARPLDLLDEWMTNLNTELAAYDAAHPDALSAPWGVNLIVHKSNKRLQEDIDLVLKHKPPLVITSVGHPGDIVEKIHSYGGVVFHDVIHMHHARKAAAAGVDGIIAVCGGAGGHAGLMNPFTFIPQLRKEFPDLAVLLAGTISDGTAIKAATVLGADFAYMGTRFIATKESNTDEAYRKMIEEDGSADIVYTDKISGIKGNFLLTSVKEAGLDPETGDTPTVSIDFDPNSDKNVKLSDQQKERIAADKAQQSNRHGGGIRDAWKTIWSAGQGIGMIDDSPNVKDLVDRLVAEYESV